MAKRRTPRRVSKTQKARILAAARSQGLTADQVAKKFGISKWTYYNWCKKPARATRASRHRKPAASGGLTAVALRAEVRALLPRILQDELARLLTSVLRGRRTRPRWTNSGDGWLTAGSAAFWSWVAACVFIR